MYEMTVFYNNGTTREHPLNTEDAENAFERAIWMVEPFETLDTNIKGVNIENVANAYDPFLYIRFGPPTDTFFYCRVFNRGAGWATVSMPFRRLSDAINELALYVDEYEDVAIEEENGTRWFRFIGER